MLLETAKLNVSYGSIPAVRDVSLTLEEGEIVAILGANGAGKSSLLRCVLGLEPALSGWVFFRGENITKWTVQRRVRSGIALVPEGRRIVAKLTIHENLLMGAYGRSPRSLILQEIDAVYDRFSNLAKRKNSLASVLSGGEQQMLAISRALMSAPEVIMLDEPSLGLSPRLSDEVFDYIDEMRRERGLSILLVEQDTTRALRSADRAYVLELGRVVKSSNARELMHDSSLIDAYLGSSDAESKVLKSIRPHFSQPT